MGESLNDFQEATQDQIFKPRMISFRKDLESASKMLETFLARYNYDELSLEDKVRCYARAEINENIFFLFVSWESKSTSLKYNLFLAFAINSYFWMYLRVRGVDPNQHDIKEQINRVRKYMNWSKKIYEKKTLMPRIDQDAAKRFVRSGLWTPENLDKSGLNPAEAEIPLKRLKKESDG